MVAILTLASLTRTTTFQLIILIEVFGGASQISPTSASASSAKQQTRTLLSDLQLWKKPYLERRSRAVWNGRQQNLRVCVCIYIYIYLGSDVFQQ